MPGELSRRLVRKFARVAPALTAGVAAPVRNRPIAVGSRWPVRKPAVQASGRGLSSGHPFRTNRPMPRAFAYVRVSTIGPTTDNQLGEIAAAGFAIEPRRVVAETVSGSVAT